MSQRESFLSDSLYGVGCVCVLSAIVEGAAVSLTHPTFGSFWDSRLGLFTFIVICSFAIFQSAFSIGNRRGFWLQCTLYGSIVLSAPGGFYMFNMFMWMQFAAADGIIFPILSFLLLIANILLYRKPESSGIRGTCEE